MSYFGYKKYTSYIDRNNDNSYRFTVTFDYHKGHRLDIFNDYGYKASTSCLVASITRKELSSLDAFLKNYYSLAIILTNLVEWYQK